MVCGDQPSAARGYAFVSIRRNAASPQWFSVRSCLVSPAFSLVPDNPMSDSRQSVAEVGRKFGKLLDVHLMQKILD